MHLIHAEFDRFANGAMVDTSVPMRRAASTCRRGPPVPTSSRRGTYAKRVSFALDIVQSCIKLARMNGTYVPRA